MHVIGTAGHVDHGKSTLVQALTGINPDRLKEEQEREMTIELGFAWLTLPSGESVSVIDVPGHEDFIRHMLAGVGGIDAALLIVAADEGVMPQTREHLAILDLLKVKNGLVALTKSDLVQDPEWLELAQADVATVLKPTTLANAKIIPVSARTKQGLKELLAELDNLLRETPTRRDLGRPRLAIDRVFTMSGFGTVVTGTLIDGKLRVGDEIEILPGGLKARIRGLQSHKTKLETALPGSRVAVNLSGVELDQVARGETLTRPGWLTPTSMIDVRLDVLADAPNPLRHNLPVEFYSGSTQVIARTRILGAQAIAPGESGWVQLTLAAPIAVVKNDRFILRQPSPSRTIGGGVVVEPHPQHRHPRFRPQIIRQLETSANGSPEEMLFEALQRTEPADARSLVRQSNLAQVIAEEALNLMLAQGLVTALGTNGGSLNAAAVLHDGRRLVTTATWQNWIDQTVELVGDYHRQHPMRVGMLREEVKSRLKLETRIFDELIADAGRAERIVPVESVVRLPNHTVKFSALQQAQVDKLLKTFSQNRFTPPSVAEAEMQVGVDVFNALVDQGKLVKVSADVVFAAEAYHEMVERIVQFLKSNPSLTVAQVRDLFGASRKYALALMEYLDNQHITRRIGDERVLR
jgi:selenocysteine-specific elongation factor